MSIISKDLNRAKQLLESNELVAIPTETVYGLAGNIYSETAIKQIFKTKERPLFNPLIVHIPDSDYLENVAMEIPEKASKLAKKFWPGPLTLVLNKKPTVPVLITAGKDTVAVRVPNHPVTLKLLKTLDFPLAAPSANPFGNISPTRPEHVEKYFSKKIKMVLDGGACKEGIESTIVGFNGEDPIVYRLGTLSIEEIEAIIGPVSILNKKEVLPDAPGMLERHYAPKTTTILSDSIQKTLKTLEYKKIGLLSFGPKKNFPEVSTELSLSESSNLEEAAQKLYDAMHQLDAIDLDVIIIEKLPETGIGRSINDRILRATK
ncbi:L-threonylcarbamoyladenylate synthase [Winogradskyella aurantiaca]|uniref:L-threonylcarbamoyladenylate synthase n=1 Tax=Winogradskyella aurantiaca TaxID=2219558 RepID=UPI000E1DF57D|nr:L-threonylcarbamoyladenylate synthase [Winogradskyella aurantiaca]